TSRRRFGSGTTIVEKPPFSARGVAGNHSAASEAIKTKFLETGDPDGMLADRTALVDRLVLDAYDELIAPTTAGGLALAAVGGYGRRQLFPHSDVDLLFLFASERLAQGSKELISPFLQRLWDSVLRLSHSVRTPADGTAL